MVALIVSCLPVLPICRNVDLQCALTVAGQVDITNTTQSNSCTTGALVVAGGVGIGDNLYVCGTDVNDVMVR